jgi:hypothetical protein
MARQAKAKNPTKAKTPDNAPPEIKATERAAIERGFVASVTEAENSWNLSLWHNGHQKALIQLSKGTLGTTVSRFYDRHGTCIRCTTDSPAVALRQCSTL